MRAQPLQNLRGLAQAETGHDQPVELDIERVEARGVAGLGGGLLVAQVAVERLARRGADVARHLARDLDLDGAADHQPFAHVRGRDLGDERPVLRLDRDQTLVGQPVDRGRDREPRHVQTLAERNLVDGRARLQGAAEDRLLHVGIDHVGLRAAALAAVGGGCGRFHRGPAFFVSTARLGEASMSGRDDKAPLSQYCVELPAVPEDFP